MYSRTVSLASVSVLEKSIILLTSSEAGEIHQVLPDSHYRRRAGLIRGQWLSGHPPKRQRAPLCVDQPKFKRASGVDLHFVYASYQVFVISGEGRPRNSLVL